jgi:hypothetical protein
MPSAQGAARDQSELYALRAIVVAILKTLKEGNSHLAPIVVGNISSGAVRPADVMLAAEHVEEAIARMLDEAGLE